ncbi:MAG TPA: Ig-like domain-containing protein [Vicinamibacterales bacterium]|nr:Ig-like domain-containing protein [Vicinamibacterales bacterium]
MVPRRTRLNMVRVCAAVLLAGAVCAGALLLPAQAQAPADNALPFTRSYLLTGNYAVVGVDLTPQQADCSTFAPDCYAKGSITVPTCPTTGPVAPGSCIPEGADVLAAWMYWEAIATDPAVVPKARLRVDGSSTYTTLLKARRNDELLPSQGSCLSSSGNLLTLSMFSADVLRFFPFQKDANNAATPRRKVTGTHGIALAEIGNGNNAKQGAGASLFFVYRLPSEPLRKVVVYDGAYMQPLGATMRQQLQGFYQSAAGKSAWLTHIVGSGAKNTTERMFFNNSTAPIGTDLIPFPLGSEGGSGSDRAWANPTVDVSGNMAPLTTAPSSGFGETVWTSVDHTSNSPYECLSWAAVIFSTAVKDADRDGLPDGLEDAANGLKDPDPADLLKTLNQIGRDLPNLNAMGASSGAPDVMVEMNGMWAPPGTTYGDNDTPASQPSKAPFSTILGLRYVTSSARHDHLPTPESIRLMGEALENAPTSIRLHVDVGDVSTYKSLAGFNSAEADKYLICTRASGSALCASASPHARGGEIIEETECDPSLGSNPTQANSLGCHFPYFPGTVGWKFGLEHYRDQAVGKDGVELTKAQRDSCYATGSYSSGGQTLSCQRRFDPIRNGLFHYFLYAHAMGVPKGKQCLDASGKDVDPVNGACGVSNPNFFVPRSTSGAGDAPGSNALITVGLWDLEKHVGSPFLVATTSVHELGHNFDLSHGGGAPVWGNASTASRFEVNCKPNYPSIMSYLFQVNGLLDLDGNARIDFSRGVYGDTALTDATVLDEGGLHDNYLLLPDRAQSAAFRYRTAWFVPVIPPTKNPDGSDQPGTGNFAGRLGIQPATRYCTGVKSDSLPSMGRYDGPGLNPSSTTLSLIDFDLDPQVTTVQDVNFDGTIGSSYRGFNDWGAIRLDQMAGGKNPAGFSLGQGGFEFGQGGFDFGQGGFEFGQGGFDFGQGGFEFGQGGFEFGQGGFEFGQGGFDFGDGSFSFGQGGFEFGQGGFEFGQGGFDYGQGGFDYGNDIDYDLVKKNGHTPPLAVVASVIQAPNTTNHHRNQVSFVRPNVGTIAHYKVFRVLGTTITGSSTVEQLCGVTGKPACSSSTTFVDAEELPYNQWFTYFVRAVFGNCNPAVEKCESGPSNFAPVQAQNNAPSAGNDPSGTQNFTTPRNTPLVIAAPGVLLNDTDPDSPKSRIRIVGVTSPPSHGSVVLNAATGAFTYTPVTNYDGPDSFSYTTDNGVWRPGTPLPMSPTSVWTVNVTVDKKK